MKHYLIISAFVLTCLAAQGQTGTTKNKTQKAATDKTAPKENAQVEKSYPTKNMMKVAPSSIPAALTKTLKEEQYTGWEKGHLYFDKKSREYALLLPSESPEEANMKYNRDITGKKTPLHTGWYFFTEEGQPISN